MNEEIIKRLEQIVKREFYREYNLNDDKDNRYIVEGGIITENVINKRKHKRKKKKGYCATNYMSIE